MKVENIKVTEAAAIMDKRPQYIRIGLQRGLLPFGSAVKTAGRWSYHIPRDKFYEYMGIENQTKDVQSLVSEKIVALVNAAEDWDRALKIRAFVHEVELKDINNEKSDWIQWAYDMADRIDPTI